MPVERLIISSFPTGYETYVKPFLLDNSSFPVLNNAYEWRKRILRKRGTALLGRLRVPLTLQNLGNTDGAGAFSGNIFTILGINVFAPDASVVIGSISITVGAQVFTEPSPADGTLSNGAGGTGTINYQTGALTLQTNPVLAATAVIIAFAYFPALPVLGFEDFDVGPVNEDLSIAFDTKFSYGFNQGTNLFYNVNFYKSTGVAFQWHGADYQQFYSANYMGITTITDSTVKSGCLFVTNGNPGFHFITITNVVVANPNTINAVSTVTTSAAHNLTNSDFVFINEVNGITSGGAAPSGTFGGINGASGQVTVTGANTFTLPTPWATGAYISGGIVQYMTRSSDATGDGIRWYDGDPTVSTNFGWVNFAPPLSKYHPVDNPRPLYLVGCKIIYPFKNRLLCFDVTLRTSASSPGNQHYPNRFVYSQVGTPFYSLPLPFNLTGNLADPEAWFQDIAGRGGFLTAPITQQIVTVDQNEDILIVGFENQPLKIISTGDDILPFIFQSISSELGAMATYASVTLDAGSVYIGEYGISLVTSTSAQRIDLQILDQVFEIARPSQQIDRISGVRDFQQELIYFTFPAAQRVTSTFPNRTFLYNYREQTWATFDENYTRYGTFRRTTNTTWATIGAIYPSWSVWTTTWDFGANQAFFPTIVGGNQQGFVLLRGYGTSEGTSQYIQSVSGISIVSPDHCLNTGDFIKISAMIGSTNLNGTIQQIRVIDKDTFQVDDPAVGTYLGGGVYVRLYVPFIQTKQFPPFWKDGRGVRLGTQRLLLDSTSVAPVKTITNATQANPCVITSANHGLVEGDEVFIQNVVGMTELNDQSYIVSVIDLSNFSLDNVNSIGFSAYISGGQWSSSNEAPQITLNTYSSQNANNPSNLPAANSYLAFSNVVLTGPEPGNEYSAGQEQIWHRQSNSFNGDSVQVAITLSEAQMRHPDVNQQEIVLNSIVLDLYPGAVLS